MASRAYLLARLEHGLEHDGVARVIGELEQMSEVAYAEAVVGPYDLVVTAETDGPIEQLADSVARVAGVVDVVALGARAVPTRARMWRNLSGIPQTRQS